jgi:hypothetical protein
MSEKHSAETTSWPSYCCQTCGAEIGWIGRGLQAVVGCLSTDCGLAKRPSAKAQLRRLKWRVCESEVLRDPALTGEARQILTELADVQYR